MWIESDWWNDEIKIEINEKEPSKWLEDLVVRVLKEYVFNDDPGNNLSWLTIFGKDIVFFVGPDCELERRWVIRDLFIRELQSHCNSEGKVPRGGEKPILEIIEVLEDIVKQMKVAIAR